MSQTPLIGAAPSPLRYPLPVIRQSYENFSATADLAAARHGYPCRAGCSHCCFDAVPVTDADLAIVREGISKLAPSVQQKIDQNAIAYAMRFAAAVEARRGAAAAGVSPEASKAGDAALPPPPNPIDAYEEVAARIRRSCAKDGAFTAYAHAIASAGAMRELLGAGGAPCPLLQDNLCAVYDSRPIYCRGHFAKGPDACKAGPGLGSGFARGAITKIIRGMTLRAVGVLGMELATDAAKRIE